MSKKNNRTVIKKRHDVVKKQMVDQERKRQERNHLKQLCSGVKSQVKFCVVFYTVIQLRSISLGHSSQRTTDAPVEDVEMKDAKRGVRGTNFLRVVSGGQMITARRKKVLKQSLKRQRKLNAA
ncbi:efflux membrane fusion subunit family secretion protein, putative [Babesia ovata]|uniref:Efflux membrane fusion subunit family secretion protein, putative n=1 Tax=Babesia ovata TaxID=189622 RepID=A0A2H6K8D3_9APIC|nr:efflux membrane fusion subunit family secretion protein, putative [Babesia ovata]GBE59255.1 efflux membrane fusion subunit family secretion protein, putative [Babesia ovata]